ncbi:hypothetical protein A2419_01935 [Candidatus Adlerbacteria bacterium RIFOXYC1_FULL_48_26]|jgi:hypothetical protein|uniref:Secreted protein n=1 Tax=Candidatus Adlerbacteria bacterium RIFOXYC1_FULL_48_26 TaxID=1797247 RepID=A0A1F4Y3E0_9BACT|nr:MAG: hypothetical protein A2419_01935 [Candidatus Adlerbacteria bacterium RIFOXYC1_FULL_48_26]OGC93830.1 MAG: hypothetical protein A2389_00235 [Candidatus Adlerbacteria bacterium RIFOXYB1_FULL_48_10]OGC96418.1 MAG: hypothetical protein A2590_00265 [Candidatus Adlerbacteria bacterium RIFOXYD1_FULL_48_8]
MKKIFFSLLIVALMGGVAASLAESAEPGSPLHAFKVGVTDNVASALCSVHLPCSKENTSN